jgi:hypothetical protein
MDCHLCGGRAVGACRHCGRFYCGQHGGPRWNGVCCDPCYSQLIARGILGALFGVMIAVVAVAIAIAAAHTTVGR